MGGVAGKKSKKESLFFSSSYSILKDVLALGAGKKGEIISLLLLCSHSYAHSGALINGFMGRDLGTLTFFPYLFLSLRLSLSCWDALNK